MIFLGVPLGSFCTSVQRVHLDMKKARFSHLPRHLKGEIQLAPLSGAHVLPFEDATREEPMTVPKLSGCLSEIRGDLE